MYDNLKVVTYSFPAQSFATNGSAKLLVPKGAKMARVMDTLITCTTTFTQVTTPGILEIGDGTTANKFWSLTIGGLTAGNTMGAGDVTLPCFQSVYDAGAYVSALHDLTATFVAPTGGTPAGVANLLIVIGYDQITP